METKPLLVIQVDDVKRFRWFTALVVLTFLVPAAAAQDLGPGELRVFLDCQRIRCDFDYLRREIVWVNWVRDRQDADVHLLVTSEGTGSGGRQATLRYIGLRALEGRDLQLLATTPETATDDEERQELARVMRVGLAGYAGALGYAGGLDVIDRTPFEIRATQQQELHDPWNRWVFRVNANANLGGESRESSNSYSGSVRATRTTDDWKISLSSRGSRTSSHFIFEDSTTYDNVTSSIGFDGLIARSLGRQWSAGALTEFDRSDRENLDASFRVAAALEYNFWPYAESSRRQLIVLYSLGRSQFDYVDSTVFDLVKETRFDQRLLIALATREPWGTSQVTLEGQTYLHDLSRNEFTISGGVSIRLYKGLSVNTNAYYSRVRNQLNIAKGGATDEEVLLRLRELETGYRYQFSVGFSYSFGSIYNNIVNPRFREDNF